MIKITFVNMMNASNFKRKRTFFFKHIIGDYKLSKIQVNIVTEKRLKKKKMF